MIKTETYSYAALVDGEFQTIADVDHQGKINWNPHFKEDIPIERKDQILNLSLDLQIQALIPLESIVKKIETDCTKDDMVAYYQKIGGEYRLLVRVMFPCKSWGGCISFHTWKGIIPAKILEEIEKIHRLNWK